MNEMLIDLRTAFVNPPALRRAARFKGVHDIDLGDVIDRDAARTAGMVVITDGGERRMIKTRYPDQEFAFSLNRATAT